MSHAHPNLIVLLDQLASVVTAVAKDSFLDQTTKRPAIVSINQHRYYFVHLDHEINACLVGARKTSRWRRQRNGIPSRSLLFSPSPL